MDEKEIVASQAFKILNHQIDEKAEYLRVMILAFRDRVDSCYRDHKFPPSVDTRISYEVGGGDRGQMSLAAHPHELKELAWNISEITQTQEDIRKLQRLKLQLVNDYDFTHGDDSLQKKIFG